MSLYHKFGFYCYLVVCMRLVLLWIYSFLYFCSSLELIIALSFPWLHFLCFIFHLPSIYSSPGSLPEAPLFSVLAHILRILLISSFSWKSSPRPQNLLSSYCSLGYLLLRPPVQLAVALAHFSPLSWKFLHSSLLVQEEFPRSHVLFFLGLLSLTKWIF